MPTLTIPPQGGIVRATLIFLHGLGDSGRGWYQTMQHVAREVPGLRILLPDAPNQPVTINGGMRMPSWYDIANFSEASHDYPGMEKSRRLIECLIDEQENKDKDEKDSKRQNHHRWLVGGFSQGAVIALLTALHCPRVQAAICLSGYFPKAAYTPAPIPSRPNKLSIWLGHGTKDDIVQYQWGHSSYLELSSLMTKSDLVIGDVQFKSYPGMGHSSCDQEMADIVTFLRSILTKNDASTKVDL